MNHILSLPEKNIKNLAERDKVLLVMQKFPSNFNHKRDVFILENEDSGLIYGTVKIARIYWREKFIHFMLKFSRDIAFIDGSLWSYLTSKKGFYVFQCYSLTAYKQSYVKRKKAVQ